ncbi:MAG: hypothetical protein DMG30_29145, partial [Acidobacteria bacterium]
CAFYTILLKRLRLTSLTDKRKPSSRFRGLRAPDRARRAGRRGAAYSRAAADRAQTEAYSRAIGIEPEAHGPGKGAKRRRHSASETEARARD